MMLFFSYCLSHQSTEIVSWVFIPQPVSSTHICACMCFLKFTPSVSPPYSACLIHMYTPYILKAVISTIGVNKWSRVTCRHFRRLYVLRVENKMSFMITFLISIIFRLSKSFGVYFNLNTISMRKLCVAPVKKLLIASSKQGWSML